MENSNARLVQHANSSSGNDRNACRAWTRSVLKRGVCRNPRCDRISLVPRYRKNKPMNERRSFILGGAGAAAAILARPALAQAPASAPADARLVGTEHWTTKRTPDGDVRLLLWRK